MPTNIIMPALELAQETGKVVNWLKRPGDAVQKGEPIVEIETDKVTVEIEAPASGVLRDVTAREGDVVPVGQTIAVILAAGETGAAVSAPAVMPAAHAAATRAVPTPPIAGNASAGAGEAAPPGREVAQQDGGDPAAGQEAPGRHQEGG